MTVVKATLDYLVYVVVRLFVCVIQAMRIETGHAIARALAWLAADVFHIRAKVLNDNLSHAFAELSGAERDKIARQMWEHLFLLVVEVAHTPRKIHETNWRDYISLRGSEIVVRELLSDRPTILVTAHVGNFEVGGYILGLLGFPTHTVARTLDNPHLDRFVNSFRGKTGQFIIPKNGGFDQIVDVLDNGGRDDFSGRPACRPQRLLGGIFRTARLCPQGDFPSFTRLRRPDRRFLFATAGPALAFRSRYLGRTRTTLRRRHAIDRKRTDPVVHRPTRRLRPRGAQSVLVDPQPLERSPPA